MIAFDERIWIAGELDEDQLVSAKNAGIGLVIDLRADGEPVGRGLDPAGETRVAAHIDLLHRRFPIVADRLCRQRFDEVGRVVAQSGVPVLVHCASGRRAAVALVASQGRRCGWSAEQCAKRIRQLGFDLEGMPLLRDALAAYVALGEHRPPAVCSGDGI